MSTWPKYAWRGNGLFHLTLPSYNPPSMEAGVGNQGKRLKRKRQWLLHSLTSVHLAFLSTLGPLAWGWNSITSISTKKIWPTPVHRPICLRQYPNTHALKRFWTLNHKLKQTRKGTMRLLSKVARKEGEREKPIGFNERYLKNALKHFIQNSPFGLQN